MDATDRSDLEALLRRTAAIADRDSDERWAVVQELHGRTDRVAFDVVCRFARSRDVGRRALAIDTLAQFGYRTGRPFLEDTMPIVIAACSDRDRDVYDAAINALGHLRDPRGLAPVLKFVGHRSSATRFSVACALPSVAGDPPASAAVAALIRLTADRDSDVRDWATFGLGVQLAVDGREVRDALAARLMDPDGDTAGEALVGLARRGDPRALPALLAWLDAGPGNLIVEAAAALGHPDALPVLLQLKEEGWQDDEARPEVLDEAIAACSRAQ